MAGPTSNGRRARPGRPGDVHLGDLDPDLVHGRGGVGGGAPGAQRAQRDRGVPERQGRDAADRDAVVAGDDQHAHGRRRRGVRGAADPGPPHGEPLQGPEGAGGQQQVLDGLPGLLLGRAAGGPDVGGQRLQVGEGGHGQSVPARPRCGGPGRACVAWRA